MLGNLTFLPPMGGNFVHKKVHEVPSFSALATLETLGGFSNEGLFP